MIKVLIKEDKTIINIYAPKIGTPQYVRQMLTAIKGKLNSNKIIVGALTPHFHQWTDHSDRKSIRKQRP